MSNERLSWKQIQEKYPDQWVGLIDVEYESDNKSTIKTAIVKYTGLSKSELKMLQVKSDGTIIGEYTGDDATIQIGVIEWTIFHLKEDYYERKKTLSRTFNSNNSTVVHRELIFQNLFTFQALL